MLGPRPMDSRSSAPPSMSRNLSTKQLISRFESLTSEPTSRKVSIPRQSLAPDTTRSLFTRKSRKASIRESFRNLVGLFKKGDSKSHKSRPSQDTMVLSQPVDHSSEAVMAGKALYMSRVFDGASRLAILPVWTTCTLSLQTSQLLASCVSTNGHPDTHTISLQDCSDIRSLTANQLDPNELALIPKDHDVDGLRFFELLFNDRRPEKFAVSSVHERADWVSAIWDILIATQGLREHHRSSGSTHTEKAQPSRRSETDVQSASEPTHTLPSSPTFSNTDAPTPPLKNTDGLPQLMDANQVRVDYLSLPSSSLLPDPSTATNRESRMSTLSVDKPLPVPSPAEASMWSATGSIVDAYGDMPAKAESHLTSTALPMKEFQSVRQSIDDVSRDLSHGFGKMELGMNNVSARIDRTDVALLRMSQNMTELTRQPLSTSTNTGFDPSTFDHVTTSAQTLQVISRELRSLVETLEERKQSAQADARLAERSVTAQHAATSPPVVDTGPLTEMLHGIGADIASNSAEVHEIVAMLKDECERRTEQGQQQADSVRYLNELNSWLEAFVTNGASQIGGMAGSVAGIRSTLGCDLDASGQPIGPPIAAIVLDIKEGVDALRIATGDGGAAGHPSGSITPEQLAAAVDRQSQNYDAMLRAVAAELTNEIRGERVRFVDAMKEATEINVRSHVDEFKKELKREVSAMTKEIGRLYKERQTMENQIAELFQFYSKQKQGIIPFATTQAPYQPQYAQQPPTRDGQQRRPLPSTVTQNRGHHGPGY